MKRFLIVGLLAFVGCELTESTTNEQVSTIFRDYNVDAIYEEHDSNWVEVSKSDGVFIIRKNRGEGVNIFRSSGGCEALNHSGCAVVSCPSDSVSFSFCNVKTWGIDSLSFTHDGNLLKGRYFK
jgi:hypothetical protein